MSDNDATPPLTTEQYLDLFRQGTEHLSAMAANMEVCWNPNEPNLPRLHNVYARNLITCYVAKFAELSSAILDAVKKEHYLSYALCGRSLIENAATLRYYSIHKYSPLFEKGGVDLKRLIEVDDQHLRGSRFDWESFFTKDYQKLWESAAQRNEPKADNKSKAITVDRNSSTQPNVVRVGECIKSWAAVSPGIGVVYDLFCDMVHPNIGSTFLVASVGAGGLYFAKHRGESVGKRIFERSFPMLVSATQKQIGESLAVLMATIWADDELP